MSTSPLGAGCHCSVQDRWLWHYSTSKAQTVAIIFMLLRHNKLSTFFLFHAKMASSLTAEQKQRIEENKAKALEKLRAKRAADTDSAAASGKAPKRARWTKYYEYDLSSMKDSKGGFIAEETEQDKLIKRRREEATKMSPFIRTCVPL